LKPSHTAHLDYNAPTKKNCAHNSKEKLIILFKFLCKKKLAKKNFCLRALVVLIYLDTLLTQCYEDSPMPKSRSTTLYHRARRKIPGGVNSPVRAWKSVGGVPAFIARGRGAYVFDVDGKKYIDFVASWGPLILGHAEPRVLGELRRVLAKGTSFGAPTECEVKLAELVSSFVPTMEKLRLVSSGTEATMSALRLARAFTGRTKIVKFDGCYHGHSDSLLVKAGSGIATLGLPDSPGVPPGVACETLVGSFNDTAAVQDLFDRHGDNIAAVIIEPVCGNMGVIPPTAGFLTTVRDISRVHGALLIFDEVITGFRVALGGAQELYKIRPDLTCLGKILGGGLPLAAFGGRQDVMDLLAPEGPVYQAGTLSGNPLAVAAGLLALKLLSRRGTYGALERLGRRMEDGYRALLQKHGIHGTVNRVGSMMTVFFGVDRVQTAADARRCDRAQFARYFHGMLKRGVYWPPSQFEAGFVSLSHSGEDIAKTLNAFSAWAREESRHKVDA
jgi:glutamate-1-semialdehyde 2,1-aminomutase